MSDGLRLHTTLLSHTLVEGETNAGGDGVVAGDDLLSKKEAFSQFTNDPGDERVVRIPKEIG